MLEAQTRSKSRWQSSLVEMRDAKGKLSTLVEENANQIEEFDDDSE